MRGIGNTPLLKLEKLVPKGGADIYAGFGADVTYGEYSSAHKMHTSAFRDLKLWMNKIFPAG